ncbi:hypothetical protein [Ideonella sp.]|uniref:hypothetical protein n=1 Tax=Ideonella sp. TaxID=1929293 RepID=UPI003BB6DF14
MLVWDAPQGTPNIFAMDGAGLRGEARSAYEGCLYSVRRIIMRGSERFILLQNKLSAAMIGAFKAMGGRVANSVETSYAQWRQYAVCDVQAVALRSRATSAKPMLATPIQAVRRVKAFFVSQKVNRRNAP